MDGFFMKEKKKRSPIAWQLGDKCIKGVILAAMQQHLSFVLGAK
jgi:hypothetical protein